MFDTKRAVTRFGVVQMPQEVDPSMVTIELMLTDPYLVLIPKQQLPEATRQRVQEQLRFTLVDTLDDVVKAALQRPSAGG